MNQICGPWKEAFRGTVLPVNANGEHFSVAWYGQKNLFTAEQTAADSNWYWFLGRGLTPQIFGGLFGGGLAALGSPFLGNMTMRGLLPCAAHFIKVVQEISEMKYPCNTMQGFDQFALAKGYIESMLNNHAKTVGGLCVNTLDYQEGQALAAAVLAANATAGRNNSTDNGTSATVNTVEKKKKDGLSREELALVVALGAVGAGASLTRSTHELERRLVSNKLKECIPISFQRSAS